MESTYYFNPSCCFLDPKLKNVEYIISETHTAWDFTTAIHATLHQVTLPGSTGQGRGTGTQSVLYTVAEGGDQRLKVDVVLHSLLIITSIFTFCCLAFMCTT